MKRKKERKKERKKSEVKWCNEGVHYFGNKFGDVITLLCLVW